ncbi:hypothetical protein E2C01_006697 [Portunus trituberculatus]|uniref:Uncharacterized protein n=1 Tax=Portunus trituberculatus TaxID=210409 RepID=A0A5B7CVT3_PORTR|nr:hypothetical protein [Portunus trituberculatus]
MGLGSRQQAYLWVLKVNVRLHPDPTSPQANCVSRTDCLHPNMSSRSSRLQLLFLLFFLFHLSHALQLLQHSTRVFTQAW